MSGTSKRIVIVGGGTAGISVAARLRRARPDLALTVIEPSAKHYYQPLWTLVGGGVFPREASERDEADYIPDGVTWIRDRVTGFRPEERLVEIERGAPVAYDMLVVACGLHLDWAAIRGLPEALGKDGVTSNYSYDSVSRTWDFIREFRGGTAIFTQPSTPIKCGGAPQKIMYMADDAFRAAGVRERSRVVFATAKDALFHVPRYVPTLERVVARKGIEVWKQHELVEVRSDTREAVFRRKEGEPLVVRYDLLHVTPPQRAPDVIRQSPLADAAGWVDVDRVTLRHTRFPEVFALGDASNLPTSKTGAAIRKQAPVLVENLLAALDGRPLAARYDGYTSCPIVTGYGKLVMAEFDYRLEPCETFPFDQSRERGSMYYLKAYGLPWMYWNGMLRGRL